jgi:signal transduction histidine kinase
VWSRVARLRRGAPPPLGPGQYVPMADRSWASLISFDRRHPEAADLVAAAVLGALSAPYTAFRVAHHQGLGLWVVFAALLLPFGGRRRFPAATFVVLGSVAFVQWLITVPLPADATLLGVLYTLSTHSARRTVGATAVAEAGAVAASVRWHLGGSWFLSLVGLSGLTAAAVLLGRSAAARRQRLDLLEERTAELERQRDQQAVIAAAAERARIAREMHDVIAHSLTVMVSLADGAEAKLRAAGSGPGSPGARSALEAAAGAVVELAAVGRQALSETRRLVGILTPAAPAPGALGRPVEPAELGPQPGLADLPALLDRAQATGHAVSYRVEGLPFPLAAGAELAIYRLVQEAVTNALKHASARRLDVRLHFAQPHVEVEVTDDGGAVPLAADESGGGGHGLRGMTERFSLYEGSVTAGPRPEGGWRVAAVLERGGVVDRPPRDVGAPEVPAGRRRRG